MKLIQARNRTELNGLLEVSKQFHGDRSWPGNDWIVIETAEFEEIASYLISCDEIKSEAFSQVPRISVPKPICEDPNMYARKIINHFHKLFVPHQDEGKPRKKSM